MPLNLPSRLPAVEILKSENIFVMDYERSLKQDIRPLKIIIMNLMPTKQATELQLLRSFSNTPLQVDVTFITVKTHESKNTDKSHLNKFYQTFDEIRKKRYDGLIITGAPVEQMKFEEEDNWTEHREIFAWSETHVTSTL